MKRFWLIILFTLLTIQIAQAQEVTPSPDDALFTLSFEALDFSVFFPLTEWLPDSKSFIFQTMSYYPSGDGAFPLFQYFISTHELRSLALPRPQLLISDEQQKAFAINSGVFLSISPNGRYGIFGTSNRVCDEGACSVLINLDTNAQVILIRSPATRSVVRWSADSSAFLFMDDGVYGGLGGIYYVDVAQAFAAGASFQPPILMNYSIDSPSFVDISRDGRHVLVQSLLDFPRSRGLYLWDTATPLSQPTADNPSLFHAKTDGHLILGDEIVAGASFIPDDDQHILAILDRGIVKYDLDSGTIEVIDPKINANWVTWAYFSPDVQYVLTYQKIIENKDWQRSQVALYPLAG